MVVVIDETRPGSLLNQQGLGSTAIAASLCQTLAPTDQGACVASFNAFFKGGNG
jgi:hypothetical protein